jgi:hypothetical protein
VLFSSDGEVCEEGGGLARVYLDGYAIAFETGWSEKIQGKAGHLDTSLVTSVLQIPAKVNGISELA